jgi:hypothetical protein
MSDYLLDIVDGYDITLKRSFASSRFGELMTHLHRKTGQKAVVLIDEYDSPILDTMGKSEMKGI